MEEFISQLGFVYSEIMQVAGKNQYDGNYMSINFSSNGQKIIYDKKDVQNPL